MGIKLINKQGIQNYRYFSIYPKLLLYEFHIYLQQLVSLRASTLALRAFLVGAVLCIVGCLATCTYWNPVAPSPSCDYQKCLQTISNVPWRAKAISVENHWSSWTLFIFTSKIRSLKRHICYFKVFVEPSSESYMFLN